MERTHQHSDSPNSLPSCTHIFAKGCHCRQAVPKSGDPCAVHAPSHALAAPPDPLAELASELGEISEIHQVSQFLAKVLKLACQNVISISRAAALTYIANSLLNSLRAKFRRAHRRQGGSREAGHRLDRRPPPPKRPAHAR